jgi:linoleoyl-CoA desaturase
MAHVLNLLGGNTGNWRAAAQHPAPYLHQCNAYGRRHCRQAGAAFFPHTEVKRVHRFQWVFAFLFYGITTLYWVTAKDLCSM